MSLFTSLLNNRTGKDSSILIYRRHIMAEYVLAMTGKAVNAALTKAQTDVSFSQAQSLTDAQKAIARNNIGAIETK